MRKQLKARCIPSREGAMPCIACRTVSRKGASGFRTGQARSFLTWRSSVTFYFYFYGFDFFSFRDRPTVGQRTLTPFILVRIQVPEQIKTPPSGGFFVWFLRQWMRDRRPKGAGSLSSVLRGDGPRSKPHKVPIMRGEVRRKE